MVCTYMDQSMVEASREMTTMESEALGAAGSPLTPAPYMGRTELFHPSQALVD